MSFTSWSWWWVARSIYNRYCSVCCLAVFHLVVILLIIDIFQDCCLIVYHPYRPLLQYVQDMGQEDMLLPLAWYCMTLSVYLSPNYDLMWLIFRFTAYYLANLRSVFCTRRIVNDTYRTDLCLLYPPFMIALGKTCPPCISYLSCLK